MTARKNLPYEIADVPFTRAESIAHGVAAGRMRGSDIEHPFHSIHRPAGLPSTLEWQCRAFALRMSEFQAFSHHTAASLYGLPIPLYLQDAAALQVTVRSGSPPEGRGVSGFTLSPGLWDARELVHADPQGHDLFALPVLAPALVWAQLGSSLDADDLVAVGDALVTGNEPLCTLKELSQQTATWRGRRGVRAMARALPHIRVGPLSRPESLQRLQLVRAGFPEPDINVVVTDRNGSAIAMADEVWPEFRTLVEYEGDGHRTSKGKFRSDITRVERYADGDWFALRSHADDVFDDPNPFMERLWRRLRARGWRPQHREPRRIAGARP